MNEMKWCYSANAETFTGSFETRLGALQEAIDASSCDYVTLGRCKPLDFMDIAKSIVGRDELEERVFCQISDVVGDCAEDAVSREDFAELESKVLPIVSAWLEKHFGSYYEVTETEEVKAAP